MTNKLVSHIRDNRNRIMATLVAISPDQIGISICRPTDQCNKRFAVYVATKRAELGKVPKIPNRKVLLRDNQVEYIESLISGEYYHLKDRAERYFKKVKV